MSEDQEMRIAALEARIAALEGGAASSPNVPIDGRVVPPLIEISLEDYPKFVNSVARLKVYFEDN